jgi:dihydrofolate synthase/folylpolyglutamate synthase
MDFATALDWWLHRVDFEKRPARRDELRLDCMRSLLTRLGNPQDRQRIIHVAGSKGKGSTSAMFEAVARSAGLRTGLFTSPHLCDVRERIQVNGQPIGPDQLATRLTEIRHIADSLPEPPTFFEIATALAFHHFSKLGVELAIIEVGLGGRFDSTNACRPILSVITSISHDHTAILGDKLSQIAFEKSGIIKPGIPMVSGVVQAEAAHVVRDICRDRKSPLIELDHDFAFEHIAGRVDANGITATAEMKFHVAGSQEAPGSFIFDVNLLGRHQAANASLVVAARPLLAAAGIDIRDDALRAGFATVRWPARMEVFPGSPLTVLDCAHNVASAHATVDTLNESFPKGRRTLVFASSNDKDVPGILRVLLPEFHTAVFCRYGNNPRAVPAEQLAELAHSICPDMPTRAVDNPLDACAIAFSTSPEIVVVTGSVFLAGEVRPTLLANR